MTSRALSPGDAGETDSCTTVPTRQVAWHPKVTPHRALVLSFGVSLGMFKVLLVHRLGLENQKGEPTSNVGGAATRIEWLVGVVFFVLFFGLKSWEKRVRRNDEEDDYTKTYGDSASKKDWKKSRRSLWFFEYDCMTLLWRAFKVVGIGAPAYSTVEDSTSLRNRASSPFVRQRYRPLINVYRLMVACVVVCFEGVKRVRTRYMGTLGGATALDWGVLVVAATCLYIIGLYENNPKKNEMLFGRITKGGALSVTREALISLCCIITIAIPIFGLPLCNEAFNNFLKAFLELRTETSGWDRISQSSALVVYLAWIFTLGYGCLIPPFLGMCIIRARYFTRTTSITRRKRNAGIDPVTSKVLSVGFVILRLCACITMTGVFILAFFLTMTAYAKGNPFGALVIALFFALPVFLAAVLAVLMVLQMFIS